MDVLMKAAEDDPTYWDGLIGLDLQVPCSSWTDHEYALKCFGEGYESRIVIGKVQKYKLHRSTKHPLFEIYFKEKKGDKLFAGYHLEYVLKYSNEVPQKYHKLKSQYIVDLSNASAKAATQPDPSLDTNVNAGDEEKVQDVASIIPGKLL